MKSKLVVCVALAVVLGLVTGVQGATLIDSFEGGVGGWDNLEGDTIGPGTVGVTDGAASLQRNGIAGWRAIDLDISGMIDELNANDTLLVDVTTSQQADESIGWYLETVFVLQGGRESGPTDDYYNQGPLVGVASPDGSLTTTTVAFNYGPTLTNGPVVWWAKIRIINNTGGDGVVYYDNVRLTPEPATMSLLGLGGLALLRRRK